jgi:hypothetical protein
MLDASFGQAPVREHSKVPAERHERVMLHRCAWRGVEFRETWLGEFRNHAFDGDLCALGELRLCSRDRGGDVKTPPDSFSAGRTVPTSAPIVRLVELLGSAARLTALPCCVRVGNGHDDRSRTRHLDCR